MNTTPAPTSRRAAVDAAVDSAPSFPGRTLPHSVEAEANLLSCCILDGTTAVARCLGAKLTAKSFYDPKHGSVFAALVALHGRQDAIDTATVAEELRTRGELEAVGGFAFICQVSGYVPTTSQLVYFLRVVREYWILREVIRAASKLSEDCRHYDGDMKALLSPPVVWFQSALARVVHGERAGGSLSERGAEVKQELAARAAGTEDTSRWIHTGMPTFDKRCRPLGSDSEDHLVVIGGGSGHGKSALMRQWAGSALLAGKTVVNYTRETSIKGWLRQLGSNWARCDLRTLAEAPADHAKRLQDEMDRMLGYVDKSLFVYQQEPGCSLETIEDLVAHARSWAWQHGAPSLVVIDYLQLFSTARRVGSREQEVAHISHTIQALQRELGSVFVIGAQLNEAGLREMREAKHDEDGRLLHRLPTAGDFRESQAIYHDADRVIAMYRPPEDCRGAVNYGPDVQMPEQWLVQIKRRYGGEAAVKCWFEKRFLNFREFVLADHAPAEAPSSTPASAAPPSAPRSKNQWKGGAK